MDTKLILKKINQYVHAYLVFSSCYALPLNRPLKQCITKYTFPLKPSASSPSITGSPALWLERQYN